MRIGIITHHYVNNFGAFLQAWALQGEVRRLMPDADVCVVDLVCRRHACINALGIFRPRQGVYSPAEALERARLLHGFARARRKSLCLTAPVHTAEQINRLNLDVVIVGSDEVWNYADRKSVMPVKYGVGLNRGRLVAYAPSVGDGARAGRLPEELARGLARFDRVCARDEATRLLLNGLGLRAEPVLDPVFLFPPKTRPVRAAQPYVLIYACARLPKQARRELRAYAARRGAVILGAGDGGAVCDRRTVDITPFEWAQLFAGAECVVTGSLHGAILSILHHKRFICWPGNGSRRQKLRSLLGELELDGRMLACPDDAVRLLEREIDYTRADELLAAKRARSEAYLLAALEGKR